MPPVGTRNDPTKLLPLPKENKTPSPANLDGSKVRKRSATGAASTASSRPRSNVKANVKGFVNKLVEKKTAWEKKKAEKKAEKKAAKHAEARGDVRASTKRGKEPSVMPHDDEAANVPTAAEPRRAESDLGSFFEAAWRALETEPEKSSLGTPTERTDHLSVMSHAKAVNVLNNARISKKEYNVQLKFGKEILAAVDKYDYIRTLVSKAVQTGNKQDYLAATSGLVSLLSEDNQIGVRGAFAEAVLTRVFFKLNDRDLEALKQLQAQEFVNSVPKGETKWAYLEAKTEAATAVNIMQNALDKRVEVTPVERPKATDVVGFALVDNTTHRYRQKPMVPAGRAIVNMATAQNEKNLREAAKQFGDGVGWLMGDTAPGGEKIIDDQLRVMARQELSTIAGIEVDKVVDRLGELTIKVAEGAGKPDSRKSRYDEDELGNMKELLYFAKDRAAELLA